MNVHVSFGTLLTIASYWIALVLLGYYAGRRYIETGKKIYPVLGLLLALVIVIAMLHGVGGLNK